MMRYLSCCIRYFNVTFRGSNENPVKEAIARVDHTKSVDSFDDNLL